MNKLVTFDSIMAIAVVIIFVSILISIRMFRTKRKAVSKAKELIIPSQMPAEGVKIPVLETLMGPKAFGPITLWQNSINPLLVLYEDHFEFRAFRKKSALYSDIEMVRSFRSQFFNRMRISFKNSGVSFTAILPGSEILDKILDFLEVKGIIPEPGDKM